VHVLVGTYDLLDFRKLNGQAARRGYDIHFPRYRLQHDAGRQAFQGALHSLLLQMPLAMDLQELMNHWHYFYERSIGCVGVLKDWLVRPVASTLRVHGETLTLARLQAHALSNAQCESMAMDAHAAEQKLQFTESSREHLWSLLGMSTMGSAELHTAPGASQSQSAVSSSRATRAPKTTASRVGCGGDYAAGPANNAVLLCRGDGVAARPDRAHCSGKSGVPGLWGDANPASPGTDGDVSCACQTSDEYATEGRTVDQTWHPLGTLTQAKIALLATCACVHCYRCEVKRQTFLAKHMYHCYRSSRRCRACCTTRRTSSA
jgi:hypothetical protein